MQSFTHVSRNLDLQILKKNNLIRSQNHLCKLRYEASLNLRLDTKLQNKMLKKRWNCFSVIQLIHKQSLSLMSMQCLLLWRPRSLKQKLQWREYNKQTHTKKSGRNTNGFKKIKGALASDKPDGGEKKKEKKSFFLSLTSQIVKYSVSKTHQRYARHIST